jgi:hypothetical protein
MQRLNFAVHCVGCIEPAAKAALHLQPRQALSDEERFASRQLQRGNQRLYEKSSVLADGFTD